MGNDQPFSKGHGDSRFGRNLILAFREKEQTAKADNMVTFSLGPKQPPAAFSLFVPAESDTTVPISNNVPACNQTPANHFVLSVLCEPWTAKAENLDSPACVPILSKLVTLSNATLGIPRYTYAPCFFLCLFVFQPSSKQWHKLERCLRITRRDCCPRPFPRTKPLKPHQCDMG